MIDETKTYEIRGHRVRVRKGVYRCDCLSFREQPAVICEHIRALRAGRQREIDRARARSRPPPADSP